jgi:peroxiredoxin
MLDRPRLALALLLLCPASLRAEDDEPPKSAAAIVEAHDRSLVRDLQAYIRANPQAEDLDQAYLSVFETAVKNDWFAETEDAATQYLAAYPEGAVRPMAQIVATMARAREGQFSEAWAIYRDLIRNLDGVDQEEFAANFADSLAAEATAAADYATARRVYETLLEKFGENPALRDKVRDDLARLDLVGKPAPTLAVTDIEGKPVRLADLKGKYVLIDFWATWCAPCIADLPNLRKAYDTYHDRGLEILSISLDETPEPVTDFVQTRKVPWTQIHNATSTGDAVAAFGVNNIPAAFLIDPDGKIARLDLRGEALGKALEELIR